MPFPTLEGLPDLGIEPASPALAGDSLPLRSPRGGIGPFSLPSGGGKQSWKEGQPLGCSVGKHSWDASGSTFTGHLLCNPLTVAAEGGKAAGLV